MDNLFERTVDALKLYREKMGVQPESARELCDEIFHHPVPAYVMANVRDIAKGVGVKLS